MSRDRRGWRLAALVVLVAGACVRPRPGVATLRVGTTGDYPPFSVARGRAFAGLDLDVALRFAADSHRRLEIVRTRWPDLTPDLAADRFDLAIGGITMRPERALVGTFTRPIAHTGAVALARPGPDGRAPDLDRPGLRLAVNAGGHLERVAARLFPRAVLVRTTQNAALPGLLVSGAADAILTDDVEADAFAATVRDAIRVGPLTRDRKAFLGRDPALVAELDAWLRAREADGTLALLRGRWLGASRADERSITASDLDALLALVDLRLAFMPAVAAAKQAAGRPIRDETQEARVLAAARHAAAARGLAPAAAESLVGATVDAARAVQEAWIARPSPVEPLDLDREARPALARLSELVVARAADLAGDPDPLPLGASAIAEALDGSLVPPDARRAIADAVVAVHPAIVAAVDPTPAPPPTARGARRHRRGRHARAARRATGGAARPRGSRPRPARADHP